MGKTKDVIKKDGNIIFRFKDDATGSEKGFDPGANQVIGQIKNKGFAALYTTTHFFELLSR
jgi:phosphoribosylaminoimidazole-succinocarboxamide synthase